MKPHFRRSRTVLISAAVAALCAFGAPSAQAGPLVSSADSCASQVLEQPFLPWLDPANYVLAPGGTFENGAPGWSLDGAPIVDGDEPYDVHGAGETRSLRIPEGSSVTSPSMCVGIEHPTIRLFARDYGSLLASLKVEVLYEDAFGNVQSLQIGALHAGSGFEPTVALPIVVNLLPLLPDEHTAVAFRFTPQGGDFRIDDVYVDPFHR